MEDALPESFEGAADPYHKFQAALQGLCAAVEHISDMKHLAKLCKPLTEMVLPAGPVPQLQATVIPACTNVVSSLLDSKRNKHKQELRQLTHFLGLLFDYIDDIFPYANIQRLFADLLKEARNVVREPSEFKCDFFRTLYVGLNSHMDLFNNAHTRAEDTLYVSGIVLSMQLYERGDEVVSVDAWEFMLKLLKQMLNVEASSWDEHLYQANKLVLDYLLCSGLGIQYQVPKRESKSKTWFEKKANQISAYYKCHPLNALYLIAQLHASGLSISNPRMQKRVYLKTVGHVIEMLAKSNHIFRNTLFMQADSELQQERGFSLAQNFKGDRLDLYYGFLVAFKDYPLLRGMRYSSVSKKNISLKLYLITRATVIQNSLITLSLRLDELHKQKDNLVQGNQDELLAQNNEQEDTEHASEDQTSETQITSQTSVATHSEMSTECSELSFSAYPYCQAVDSPRANRQEYVLDYLESLMISNNYKNVIALGTKELELLNKIISSNSFTRWLIEGSLNNDVLSPAPNYILELTTSLTAAVFARIVDDVDEKYTESNACATKYDTSILSFKKCLSNNRLARKNSVFKWIMEIPAQDLKRSRYPDAIVPQYHDDGFYHTIPLLCHMDKDASSSFKQTGCYFHYLLLDTYIVLLQVLDIFIASMREHKQYDLVLSVVSSAYLSLRRGLRSIRENNRENKNTPEVRLNNDNMVTMLLQPMFRFLNVSFKVINEISQRDNQNVVGLYNCVLQDIYYFGLTETEYMPDNLDAQMSSIFLPSESSKNTLSCVQHNLCNNNLDLRTLVPLFKLSVITFEGLSYQTWCNIFSLLGNTIYKYSLPIRKGLIARSFSFFEFDPLDNEEPELLIQKTVSMLYSQHGPVDNYIRTYKHCITQNAKHHELQMRFNALVDIIRAILTVIISLSKDYKSSVFAQIRASKKEKQLKCTSKSMSITNDSPLVYLYVILKGILCYVPISAISSISFLFQTIVRSSLLGESIGQLCCLDSVDADLIRNYPEFELRAFCNLPNDGQQNVIENIAGIMLSFIKRSLKFREVKPPLALPLEETSERTKDGGVWKMTQYVLTEYDGFFDVIKHLYGKYDLPLRNVINVVKAHPDKLFTTDRGIISEIIFPRIHEAKLLKDVEGFVAYLSPLDTLNGFEWFVVNLTNLNKSSFVRKAPGLLEVLTTKLLEMQDGFDSLGTNVTLFDLGVYIFIKLALATLAAKSIRAKCIFLHMIQLTLGRIKSCESAPDFTIIKSTNLARLTTGDHDEDCLSVLKLLLFIFFIIAKDDRKLKEKRADKLLKSMNDLFLDVVWEITLEFPGNYKTLATIWGYYLSLSLEMYKMQKTNSDSEMASEISRLFTINNNILKYCEGFSYSYDVGGMSGIEFFTSGVKSGIKLLRASGTEALITEGESSFKRTFLEADNMNVMSLLNQLIRLLDNVELKEPISAFINHFKESFLEWKRERVTISNLMYSELLQIAEWMLERYVYTNRQDYEEVLGFVGSMILFASDKPDGDERKEFQCKYFSNLILDQWKKIQDSPEDEFCCDKIDCLVKFMKKYHELMDPGVRTCLFKEMIDDYFSILFMLSNNIKSNANYGSLCMKLQLIKDIMVGIKDAIKDMNSFYIAELQAPQSRCSLWPQFLEKFRISINYIEDYGFLLNNKTADADIQRVVIANNQTLCKVIDKIIAVMLHGLNDVIDFDGATDLAHEMEDKLWKLCQQDLDIECTKALARTYFCIADSAYPRLGRHVLKGFYTKIIKYIRDSCEDLENPLVSQLLDLVIRADIPPSCASLFIPPTSKMYSLTTNENSKVQLFCLSEMLREVINGGNMKPAVIARYVECNGALADYLLT